MKRKDALPYADEYFEDGVTVYNRPVLYNDYESPYRGDNVEDVLQKEEQEFRHKVRLALLVMRL